MRFEVIDVIFVTLILLIVIRCMLRGFIKEVMTMASVVLGLGTAFFLFKPGGAFIRDRYMPEMQFLPEILGFIGIFFIVFLAVKILEYILRDIIIRINLGGLDRVLGFFFGLLEGVALVSLVLFVLSMQPLFDPEPILGKSLFAQYLLPYIGVITKWVGSSAAAGRFTEDLISSTGGG
jgi:membrane protein required for colicin V production